MDSTILVNNLTLIKNNMEEISVYIKECISNSEKNYKLFNSIDELEIIKKSLNISKTFITDNVIPKIETKS